MTRGRRAVVEGTAELSAGTIACGPSWAFPLEPAGTVALRGSAWR